MAKTTKPNLWKTKVIHRLQIDESGWGVILNNEAMTEIAAQLTIQSPIGEIAIGATDAGVAVVEILVATKKKAFSDSEQAAAHCQAAASQLEEYFAGKRQNFELALDLVGTEFQKRTWEAIADLSFGEVASYRDLAHKAGKPLAARAIGGAVGANPAPLIIGCHRILGSGGKITGYSGGEGLKTKRWLLRHEGIGFRDE